MHGIMLIVILISMILMLMLLGSVPKWPHRRNGGHYPRGGPQMAMDPLIFITGAGGFPGRDQWPAWAQRFPQADLILPARSDNAARDLPRKSRGPGSDKLCIVQHDILQSGRGRGWPSAKETIVNFLDEIKLVLPLAYRPGSPAFSSPVVKVERKTFLRVGLFVVALTLLLGALGLMIAALFIALTPHLGAPWAAMIAAGVSLAGSGLFMVIALRESDGCGIDRRQRFDFIQEIPASRS
jgi:hypothetical protein